MLDMVLDAGTRTTISRSRLLPPHAQQIKRMRVPCMPCECLVWGCLSYPGFFSPSSSSQPAILRSGLRILEFRMPAAMARLLSHQSLEAEVIFTRLELIFPARQPLRRAASRRIAGNILVEVMSPTHRSAPECCRRRAGARHQPLSHRLATASNSTHCHGGSNIVPSHRRCSHCAYVRQRL